MDQHLLTAALRLPTDTPLYLVHLDLVQWGRGLHFGCEAHDAGDTKLPFALHLDDCREMRWQIYTHLQSDAPVAFPRTHLASFKLGRDQHRSPLHLLTDHFGLSLMYGSLALHQNGEIQSLASL